MPVAVVTGVDRELCSRPPCSQVSRETKVLDTEPEWSKQLRMSATAHWLPCLVSCVRCCGTGAPLPSKTQTPRSSLQIRGFFQEREFCLLKGIAEGTYNTKHAEAARLYYTTIYIHTHTPTELKLGHAHERHCDPNRLEQHVVARHEDSSMTALWGAPRIATACAHARPMVQRCW